MPATATKTDWFRADVVRAKPLGVDREKGIIRGVAVMTKGLTKDSRGVVDDVTLSQLADYGNSLKMGAKSRFGHPAMSNDALGTHLGRKKNFRVEGDKLLADLHFDASAFKTPSGDLATYVLDLAESDPDAFGASVVVKNGAHIPQLDASGNPDKTKPPLLRFNALLASDIVDNPAANSGLFSGTNVELSDQFSRFFDKFLDQPDAVDRAIKFLGRYAATREDDEPAGPPAGTPAAKDKDMDKKQFQTELNKFITAFGVENGVKWFNEDKTFEQAQVEHAKINQPTRAQFAAELKKYTDAFGAENGTKWFHEGKTFEQAQALHIEALAAKNAALEKRIKDAKLGEDTALSAQQGKEGEQKTLLEQYNAIKSPREKAAFMKENKKGLLAEQAAAKK